MYTFNRTIVELKPIFKTFLIETVIAFNRTIVELKQTFLARVMG